MMEGAEITPLSLMLPLFIWVKTYTSHDMPLLDGNVLVVVDVLVAATDVDVVDVSTS